MTMDLSLSIYNHVRVLYFSIFIETYTYSLFKEAVQKKLLPCSRRFLDQPDCRTRNKDSTLTITLQC